MIDRVNIAGDRYRWAIQRAGQSVDDYIESHPNMAISEWMDGSKAPTIKQLENFAKSVNLPFGFLFLKEPPEESIPFPVFRGEAGRCDSFDLNVYDTVNIILQRQSWLEDYLEENEVTTCPFVGIIDLRTPINEAVNRLRAFLNLDARWAFGYTRQEAAVAKMTEQLENAGVFIAYNGVVGNNTHRPLKVTACRGFALVNKAAPYIFVNSKDAPVAQLFTLVHEAVHLMLGISAGHAATDTLCHEHEERYCDMVAAEFLVPAAELQKEWNCDIKNCSRKFCVSELVIARRAHDLNLITDKEYREFWQAYRNRPVKQKKNDSRGDFYRTSLKRVGRMFAIHVNNAVRSNQLSYIEAYRLTGLHGSTYSNFMNNNI